MTKNNAQKLWERRDRFNIMAEIIETAKDGQLKTRIMYSANLSFSQVNHYLSFLIKMGLLRVHVENGKHLYETTAKGSRYIEEFREMSNLLKSQKHNETTTLFG